MTLSWILCINTNTRKRTECSLRIANVRVAKEIVDVQSGIVAHGGARVILIGGALAPDRGEYHQQHDSNTTLQHLESAYCGVKFMRMQ